MKAGIVGLPNAGKSTLFNAVGGGGAATAGYPFTTVEPNLARVAIPDPRLERLADAERAGRVVPAYLDLVDIAGLVSGASAGEGLGNRFLSHIREADCLIHVLRTFDAGDVAHVSGRLDPRADLELVEAELMLADLQTLERRRQRIETPARSGQRDARLELDALVELEESLQRGVPVRSASVSDRARALAGQLFLISRLPVMYVLNTGAPDDPAGELPAADGPVVPLSALWEEELVQLPPGEAAEFREGPSPLDLVVTTCSRLLDLVSFFTANDNQATAWSLPRGQTAWHAAGKVHSAMQQGFIRADVVAFEDMDRHGSVEAAAGAGLGRSVGRDYPVQDGDILFFRFRA